MREALPLRRARRGAVLAATTLVMAVVLVSGSPYHFDGTGVAGRVCRMEHFFADEVYPVDGDVTAALRAALIACARDPERGIEAGTVVVGPGNHTTAPFNLTSGVNLLLEAGATLFGSRQIEDYPLIAPLPSYGVTRDSSTVPRFPAARFHPLVMAYKADDVSITGEGTIDGNGDVWWAIRNTAKLPAGRPRLVEAMFGSNFTVADVTLANSAFWTLHLYAVSGATVSGITVNNPTTVDNTDGIDPDSSSDVIIEGCNITCGDDAIAIKSGWDAPGIAFGRPARNITVRDSWFNSENGVSIGSEISGGVDGVRVHNVSLAAIARGVYLKTSTTRGGFIRDVSMSNITIRASAAAFGILRNYSDANPVNPPHFAPPPTAVGNLSFNGFEARAALAAGQFAGEADAPLQGLVMDDVHVDTAGAGFLCAGPIDGSAKDVSPPACWPHDG